MFGSSNDEAMLLLMCDQIGLYCDVLSAMSPEDTQTLIERAANLDMNKIRQQMEQERGNLVSLYGRLVCPVSQHTRYKF